MRRSLPKGPASSRAHFFCHERPVIKGISLLGMPLGSPGMGGNKEGPFVIYEITEGEKKVFATE